MNTRIASVDLLSIVFPGTVLWFLFLPLFPRAYRDLLFEGDNGWQIVLFLSIPLLIMIVTIFSKLVEVVLDYFGKGFRSSFKNQPSWLIDVVLQRTEEYFGIDVDKLQRVKDTGDLKESESTNLFHLMWVFVGERAQLLECNRYHSLENLFKNLLTVFALATILYPMIQPYPLTDTFGPYFGQRLIISAICGTLTIICFLKAKTFHNAFQRDVINRFVALPK